MELIRAVPSNVAACLIRQITLSQEQGDRAVRAFVRAASSGIPTSARFISSDAGRGPLRPDGAFELLPGASAVVSIARKIMALNLSAQNLEKSFLLTSKKNIIIQ